MASRPIIYDMEQGRSYDVLWGWRSYLIALANLEQDLAGSTLSVIAGLVATASAPTSLNVALAAGRVYQQAAVDSSAYGSLPSDATLVMQQGSAAAQGLVFSTAGLSAGQSRWALVQAQVAQVDVIPSSDPTGGLLKYFNSANPSQPFEGPNNNGQTQPTQRQETVTINILYGAVATTGSEVPPTPNPGFVPLYLVDLAFGQTTIAQNQILVAGPSVGANVPSNYQQAPFMAGLLNSHHSGAAGQAPKIKLTSEVQGVLPGANGGAGIVVRSQTGTNYVYQNSDIGGQVTRSNSGTPMADTLPGPSFLSANGAVSIFNNDASALLVVSAGSGGAIEGSLTFNGFLVLGPGQSASVVSDGIGNYWVTAKPDRVVLGANTSLFVSTAGSDTANSGLSAGSPFASMQQAWNTLVEHFDLNGFVATIQLANGTYTAGLTGSTQILGAAGPQSVVFNGSATPSNVTISMVSSTCFKAQTGAQFTVQGMTLAGTGLSNGLSASGGGRINFGGAGFPIAFGAMGTGAHIQVNPGGQIFCNSNYTISGGAANHMFAADFGIIGSINNFTATLSGTPGFTTAFADAITGVIDSSEIAWSGSATGVRYSSTLNGVINTNGGGANFFPGNSAGSTATGGQYV